MIIDIRCLKTQKYHIFKILQIHWIHVNASFLLSFLPRNFTTYYNINELGKNWVKSRILWLLITESFESISSEKTGPYARAKQPSTAHLFHCIVDLECLHANCVYHSMGGSLVWFVCTLVWSNCKRAINVSITGTEMDKYLPNPPTYQTNPVPSPFYKTNIITILRNTYLGVTKHMTRRNFLFGPILFLILGDITFPKSIWATCPWMSWLSASKLCNSFELM